MALAEREAGRLQARRGLMISGLRAPTPLALAGLAAVMLAASLALSDPFYLVAVSDLMTWIGLAAALNIIMGFAGYVSFGHVVFMGIGGYATLYLMEYLAPGLADRSPLAAALTGMLLGAAVAAALAASVGAAVLRLRGAFFAIATIGLDLAVLYLAQMLPTEEGGGEIYLSGAHKPSLRTVVLLTWAVFALTLAAMVLVRKSRLGMGLEAIREDEDAAEALGVPTFRYKTIAFTLSAALTALMGGVYAWRTMSVTPGEAFNLVYSIRMIVIDVIGGLGTLLGPVVGGAIYYILDLLLSTSQSLKDLTDIVMGLIAIAVVLFFPEGIIGRLRRSKLRLAGRPLFRLLE